MQPPTGDRRRTADTMHETAESLERSEAILHDSAERSPDDETTRRLHCLGDEVTRQAKDIDRRADLLAARAATDRRNDPDGPVTS